MRVILLVDAVIDNIIEADSVDRAQAAWPHALALDGEGLAVGIGDTWDGTQYVPAAPAPTAPAPITRLDFLRRFPAPARIAIRQAAATDPIIADALQLLDLAQEVRLDDPDTLAFTGYLVQVGLLTADERAAILGSAP